MPFPIGFPHIDTLEFILKKMGLTCLLCHQILVEKMKTEGKYFVGEK